MICLDTNVVIGLLNQRPSSLVARFEQKAERGLLALSSIVLFEMEYGVAKSDRQVRNAARLEAFLTYPIAVLPFEAADARESGDILASLERLGTPIGPYDVLIAAQARRRAATLVTANTREFSRVPGLRLEDWTLP